MDAISRYVRAGLGPAAIILPAWLLIGWTLFGHGVWGFIGLIILSALAVVGLFVITALFTLRPSNRATGRLSTVETWLAVAIAVGLIWLGLWNSTSGIGAAIAIIAYLAGFWYSVREWIRDFRAASASRFGGASAGTRNEVIDIGEVIVVEEDRQANGHDETR